MSLIDSISDFTNVMSSIKIGSKRNTVVLRDASQAAKDSLVYDFSPILIKNDAIRSLVLRNSDINRAEFIGRENLYGDISFGSPIGTDANIGQTVLNNKMSIGHDFGSVSNIDQYRSYDEMEKKSGYTVDMRDKSAFMYGKEYSQITENENYGLLSYTNELFKKSKENTLTETLIGRFHTNNAEGQAVPDWWTNKTEYGLSRGRNLLKIHPTTDGGYDNPYCRVWTYHHRYSKVEDLIRPFYGDDLKEILGGGFVHLKNNDVKFNNGLVRYAPTSKDEIKRCMFSIENLAWKNNRNQLPDSQKGDIGRIMWFPPYDLSFDENVSVNWNGNDFIGRGEKIYSYVDTERSGSLSFKILIDHPRIVDRYAKHHNWEGSDGKIDDDLSGFTIGPEGTVHGKDAKYRSANYSLLRFFAGCQIIDPKDEPFMPTEEMKKPDDGPKNQQEPNKTKKLVFFVYYPNNYSGCDDWDSETGVDPISYLVDGVSSQKMLVDGRLLDIPIQDSDIPYWYKDKGQLQIGEQIGGYEVRSAKGITVNPTKDKTNRNDDGGDAIAVESFSSVTKFHLGNQKTGNDVKHNPNNTVKYWGYRVDNECSGQYFLNAHNYEDNASYRLNSNVEESKTSKYSPWLSTIEEGVDYVSLTDMYVAMNGNKAKNVLSGCFNEGVPERIRDIISNHAILSVNAWGHASIHGSEVGTEDSNVTDKSMNTKLALNRARTPIRWLQKFPEFKSVKCKIDTFNTQTETVTKDVDKEEAKLWRSAKVEIEYSVEEVELASLRNNDGSDLLSKRGASLSGMSIDNTEQGKTTEEVQAASEKEIQNRKHDANGHESDTIEGSDIHESSAGNTNINEAVAVGHYDTAWTENCDEYQYFSQLQRENPFIYDKVIEKVKYFSPAYHSITPEGFNERLTFLHQCTRQGPTYSASDNGGFADNISFGPPPVCILRIGDFYNTRVIFESLSITYDENGIQWDLNDEGIGVMPMIAKVTMQFKFLGGSDISGPISRLQNAVSHNYYANTSVYNKKSERWSSELGMVVNTEINSVTDPSTSKDKAADIVQRFNEDNKGKKQ